MTDLRAAASLRDAQGRQVTYIRISVTDRCNYRCTYCMPDDGIDHAGRSDILSFEEICALLRCFVALGVRRVRLTGGEPTVRRDIVELVRMIASLPGIDDVALSTNGHLLGELAAPLRDAGLSRLSISLDTLDPDKFRRITRRGDLGAVLRGIEAAVAVGYPSVKTNAVALRGFNDDEIGALCAWAWERGVMPRFIEQMPMAGGELWVPGSLLPASEIRALVAAAHPGALVAPDDGVGIKGAGPARYFRLVDPAAPNADRRLGIISAITEHFCDTCNRVRLSSAGHLHTCLAYDDATNLREVLAAGGQEAVIAAIRQALTGKRQGHVFLPDGRGGPRKSMIAIGG